MSHPLPLTGERTLPGVPGEEYWFARHEAAYAWILRTWSRELSGALLVEAGSGEGYGAALLRSAGARVVLALEYDVASVAHARTAYPEVATTRANLAAMPVRTGVADLVVTLQVVEHLWDLRGFLRDCRRLLRPGGRLVVSTPNRPVFSPGLPRGAKPRNPFHVEELDADQLRVLLVEAGFDDVVLHGLHHGPRITEWERAAGIGLVAAQLAPLPATEVSEIVATVTAEDFVLAGTVGAQDLVAVAVRP